MAATALFGKLALLPTLPPLRQRRAGGHVIIAVVTQAAAYSLRSELRSETFRLGRLRSGGSVLTETSSGPRIGTSKVSSMIPMDVEMRNDKFKSENFLHIRPCASEFLSYRQVSTSFVELSTLEKCGCDLQPQ